jgi:hypothetical protein
MRIYFSTCGRYSALFPNTNNDTLDDWLRHLSTVGDLKDVERAQRWLGKVR